MSPEDLTPEEQALRNQTHEWLKRCLEMADESDLKPGPMIAGFMDAAATVLATDWQGDLPGLKRAWDEMVRGFALNMLLFAWSQRTDVGPGGHRLNSQTKH